MSLTDIWSWIIEKFTWLVHADLLTGLENIFLVILCVCVWVFVFFLFGKISTIYSSFINYLYNRYKEPMGFVYNLCLVGCALLVVSALLVIALCLLGVSIADHLVAPVLLLAFMSLLITMAIRRPDKNA